MTKGKICFFELCLLHYWTIRALSIATVYRVCLGKSPSTLYEDYRKREHNPLASPSQFDGRFSTPSLRGTLRDIRISSQALVFTCCHLISSRTCAACDEAALLIA